MKLIWTETAFAAAGLEMLRHGRERRAAIDAGMDPREGWGNALDELPLAPTAEGQNGLDIEIIWPVVASVEGD